MKTSSGKKYRAEKDCSLTDKEFLSSMLRYAKGVQSAAGGMVATLERKMKQGEQDKRAG